MKSEEHQKEFGCGVAEYNFRLLQVLCQWNEEIQAPIVLRQTRKYMLLYRFGLYLRTISKYNPLGVLSIRRTIKRGFYPLRVWGAYIWRDLYMDRLIFGLLRPVLSLEVPLKNIHLPMPSPFQLYSRVMFDM